MLERGIRCQYIVLSVADAAMILAPCHLTGIRAEIRACNVVMRPDLGSTDAGEKALCHIGASPVMGICLGMVDSFRQIPCMERVPARRFIGMYGAARLD